MPITVASLFRMNGTAALSPPSTARVIRAEPEFFLA
jgi:hypothetical protein